MPEFDIEAYPFLICMTAKDLHVIDVKSEKNKALKCGLNATIGDGCFETLAMIEETGNVVVGDRENLRVFSVEFERLNNEKNPFI